MGKRLPHESWGDFLFSLYHGKKYFGSGFFAMTVVIKDHNSLPWRGVGLSPLELADATARAVAWKP